MKTYFVIAFILGATLAKDSDKKKDNTVPLSYNFDCQYYQGAILEANGNAFSPYFRADSSVYYSQAPAGQSLGQCNVIPCIGSPVFIIEKAHQYIDQQFDIANQMSSANLVAFKKDTQKAAFNSIVYRMVFELANYGGSKFIGVVVDSSIQGLGSAKYQKLILNKNLDLVLDVIGLTRAELNQFNCGDQKLYYSYYNRAGDSQIPYAYAGKNFNQVSAEIQQEIVNAQKKGDGRTCSNDHYTRVYDANLRNFFRDETSIITPPLRENFYCSAKGNAIDRIRIGCRTLGTYAPDNLEAFQLVRKNENGSLEYGPIQGAQGTAERYFKDISLTGAAEIAVEFWGADQQDPTLQTVREELRITTYDSRGKQIDELRCGEYFDHHKQGEVRINTQDFLGFWWNGDGDRNIQRLGVIMYDN